MLQFFSRRSRWPVRALRIYARSIQTPADRESLFTTTMFGYLFKEEKQRAMHRLEFDVDALASVASSTLSIGCVEIQKLSESATGRSFTLKMDNGFEFVARFPFPCAGPRKLLVQSEAATLDFLGNHFGLPVPRVAAYNSSSDKSINAVGAPYILQAKLPGRELTEDEDAAKAGPFLDELVNLQAVLSSIPFAQHGSLYYVSDVDEELRQRPLFKEMEGFEPADETLERFRIGPSVARNFYRGDRAMLDLDRGPWPDDASYFRAVTDAEIKWLEFFGSFDEARRTAWEPERDPQEHIALLKKWRDLAPKLMLPRNAPRLWHPALRTHHVRVAEDGGQLTLEGVSGWQGAGIAPLPLQATFPDFVDPRIWDDAGEAEQELTGARTLEPGASTLAPAYFEKLCGVAQHTAYLLQSDMSFVLREAHAGAARTWEAGAFDLHYCLHRLVQEWPTYEALDRQAILGHANAQQLPAELEGLAQPDMESAALWQTQLALQARLRLELAKHGIALEHDTLHVLTPEGVEDAKQIAQGLLEQSLAEAQDDEERARIKRVWPVAEERWTASAESCE